MKLKQQGKDRRVFIFSSRLDCLTLKIKAPYDAFETSATTGRTTQRHIAEDWDLGQHRYQNFTSHTHRNSG
jgi:hypothetical protein